MVIAQFIQQKITRQEPVRGLTYRVSCDIHTQTNITQHVKNTTHKMNQRWFTTPDHKQTQKQLVTEI